jgi:hypothetical protein
MYLEQGPMLRMVLAVNQSTGFEIVQDGVHGLRGQMMDSRHVRSRAAFRLADARQRGELRGRQTQIAQRVVH